MNKLTLGFIGFGEASYNISSGLIEEGNVSIFAYDIMTDHPELGGKIKDRAAALGVTLTPSLSALAQSCEIVCCTTSAKYALQNAIEFGEAAKGDVIYIDLNAASPMAMEEISARLAQTQLQFVDGAIMDSVPSNKHKVPIYISGKGSEKIAETLNAIGMNVTSVHDKPGSASAIKMIRSVFMKGFTMLLMETFSASEKYEVTDSIIRSIESSLYGRPFEQFINSLITRTAVHAERRVHEMEEVMKTLAELQVDYTMSEATRKKLEHIVKLTSSITEEPLKFTDVLKEMALAQSK